MTRIIFHLSFPVRSLQAAKDFYCTYLGATVGRDSSEWSDILLFGHQLTLHERPSEVLTPEDRGVRHFGIIFPWEQWEALGDTLTKHGCPLLMGPTVTHAGTDKEQGKILLCDPSDNLIEIKAYRNLSAAIGHAGRV
jgi:extradiol dioxygenase family protein